MIKIELEISKDVENLLTGKSLDKMLKELILAVRSKVQLATPRDTGTAQRSWTGVERISKGYQFGNVQPYSKYLETGSLPGKRPWPSPGPKTVSESGRIYSSQAPGGILKTADIENYIKQALPQLIEKYLK